MIDARKLRWWLMLGILACAGLYLMGNGRVPLWDRDEGWYAQCSKEMWETGDWVVPRFLGGLRTEKPVFVYWLQLGGYWLFGGPSEFAVRFYAAVAQVIVLVLVGVGFWKMAGPLRGVWTAFIYGTCVMAIVSAKMCLTDATMMVFVMVAQLCLMAFYLGRFRWWAALLLFVALGFAGLTKGPVALIPTAFTVITLGIIDFDKWWPLIRSRRMEGFDGTVFMMLMAAILALVVLKGMGPVLGIPAMVQKLWWIAAIPFVLSLLSFALLNREGYQRNVGMNRLAMILLVVLGGLVVTVGVCAPWLYLLNGRAPDWLPLTLNMASQHLNTPLEGHTGPFGYYMLLVWGTFFPWSLIIPTAAYVVWHQRHVPQTRFAIAAFLGPWLFFEIMKTKLPHYVLPTFPFMAFMVADALVRCTRSQYLEMYKTRFVVTALVWAIALGLIGGAPWLFALPTLNIPPISWFTTGPDLHFGGQPWAALVAASVVGLLFTFGVWWFFRQRRPYLAAAWMGGGFIAYIAVVYGWYLPEAKFLHLSYETAQIIKANGGTADKMPNAGDVVSLVYPGEKDTIGYQEPTLPFYQGGSLRLLEKNDYLVQTPAEQWPRMMVLTSEIWDLTPADIQGKLQVLGTARGLAYADGGKIYDVMVVKPKPAAAE